MKKSELDQLIREIVREEVRHILPEVLVEILKSKNKNVETDSRKKEDVRILKPSVTKKQTSTKTYVKNPILNKILNETQGGVPQEGSFQQMMQSEEMTVGSTSMIPTTDINGKPIDPETIPDHLQEALTKDYSNILKMMDKAAKAKRPK